MGKGWTAAVFLGALAFLAWQAHRTGIAAGYVDPVGGVRAQDEAVYAHSALRIARQGDPLTPRILGRYALYKPPLLVWLSALSAKLLGPAPWALRLPSLLAGALGVTLVFAWARRLNSPAAGAAAALLLLSNPLWQALSGMVLTDALLAFCVTAALFCLHRDPRLERPASVWGFGAFTAAAVMTKGIAGLLPLLVLLLCSGLARPEQSPALRRLFQAGLLVAALALPWHLYQLWAHPRWFWAEYVHVEILTFGAGSPYQTSHENPLWFYLRRAWLLDPVLCLAAVAGAWRLRREALLAAWIAVVGLAALLFHYRNAAYLLPLMPALAILGGSLLPPRRALWTLGAAALLLLGRTLSFQPSAALESAPLLDAYAQRHRPNELILVAPDDEFYAAVLSLPRVRYCLLGQRDDPQRYALDFRHLGINVTAQQFLELDQWMPIFRQRLRGWGLDSDQPVASVIVARSPEVVARIIAARPQSDFFLPTELAGPRPGATHDPVPVSPRKLLLLAR